MRRRGGRGRLGPHVCEERERPQGRRAAQLDEGVGRHATGRTERRAGRVESVSRRAAAPPRLQEPHAVGPSRGARHFESRGQFAGHACAHSGKRGNRSRPGATRESRAGGSVASAAARRRGRPSREGSRGAVVSAECGLAGGLSPPAGGGLSCKRVVPLRVN